MYASVVAQKYPYRVRELWAYQTMVVHEARRCGGKGWQVYDSMFRQQAAKSGLFGVEHFPVFHVVPSNAEPAGEGIPALHGNRPRLAGLCLGPNSRQKDSPGSRVLQGVWRPKKAVP